MHGLLACVRACVCVCARACVQCVTVCRVRLSPSPDKNDGTEHHAYHVDSGQEPTCGPRRLIAVLIYLNNVTEGGETVFLNQGMAVTPRCGRVLFFPTTFNYIHAGRRPVSNYKYVVANFIGA